MEYYRIIVDFSHEEIGEAFDEMFERLSEAMIEVLDPEHAAGSPCSRDWYMRGGSVTEEYKLYAENLTNQYVSLFKDKLKETDTVDEFLKELSAEDHREGEE